jgi:hypothetical protein
MWECWSNRTFTEQELAAAREDLMSTQFTRFKHNFLRFNVCPGDVDWFDDFSAVLNNARLAAKIARDGGCVGMLFDIEPYNAPLFDYRKQRHSATKSWDEYAEQTRVRGAELMRAFQNGFPQLTVLLTFGYSWPHAAAQGDPARLPELEIGLLAPLLDGLLAAAEPGTRIIDGFEISYGWRDPARFAQGYQTMRDGVLPFVADHGKYREFFSFAFGIWMDYDWRKHGWDEHDVSKNYFTPEAFEQSVREALRVSDEYVWIYTEQPRWWTPVGKTLKLPAEYNAALRQARRDL